MSFILNCFQIFGGLAPVFAILLLRLPLNGKKWFVATQTLLSAITVFTFLNGLRWYYPPILGMYPLFILLFNFIFTFRFGFKSFPKNLALALILGYIITELHEAPNFFVSYLKLAFPQIPYRGSHIPIIGLMKDMYLVITGYLAVKIANLKITKTNRLILISGLTQIFILSYYQPTRNLFTRIICFSMLAIIFFFWSGKEETT